MEPFTPKSGMGVSDHSVLRTSDPFATVKNQLYPVHSTRDQGSVAFILMKWECDLMISDHLVHRIQGPSLPVLSIQITPYLHDPDTTEASNLETAVSRIWLQLETAYRLWLHGLLEKIPMQSQVPQTSENRQRWSSEFSALEW